MNLEDLREVLQYNINLYLTEMEASDLIVKDIEIIISRTFNDAFHSPFPLDTPAQN